ncbi:MAG: short-chain dehydrogenase/reductase [Actinomycetia bacterium]|nr:short-chain dehydrogenase/reductase [Actinomycetes bacterium]
MNDKVAIVVGAGPGIGRACALAFAGAGADVVVAARRAEPLHALADEVAAATGRAVEPVVTDLGDVESCRALVDAAVARFGGVDALVNVATLGGGNAPVDEADWDHWRRAFEVNVLGTLEVSRSAARSMAARGGGSIVQVSTFGTHALPPRQAAYTSTKQALVTASLTLAKELGRDNVRVNIVTPGYTTGPNLDALFQGVADRTGESVGEVSTRMARTAALRRHVDPEDIAEAVLFLASDRARNITGVEIPVTAGQQ